MDITPEKQRCDLLLQIRSGKQILQIARMIMQYLPNWSEYGNAGLIERAYGKIVLVLLLILASQSIAWGQNYYINSYDSTRNSSGYYQIVTKEINLATGQVSNEIVISDEGEINNILPVQIHLPRRNILASILMLNCYCKNTHVSDYAAKIIVMDPQTFQILHDEVFPRRFITKFIKANDDSILIHGTDIAGDHEIAIDGLYKINDRFRPIRARQVNLDYDSFTIPDIDSTGLAKRIGQQIFAGIYGGHYYVSRFDTLTRRMADTLILEPFKSSSSIYALIDTVLYIFSLNYEIHLSGNIIKGYGDEWIGSNLRRFKIADFSLIDSISIPDYPQGQFISWTWGPADIKGQYIVFYFGESGDLNLLYPATLFIFDTRTNEATWLRVGWR